MSTLTVLETKALNRIVTGCSDYYDPNDSSILITAVNTHGCYCDADAYEIAKACGIEINQAKGVIGSLTKKDLIKIHEGYDYINPTESGVLEVIK